MPRKNDQMRILAPQPTAARLTRRHLLGGAAAVGFAGSGLLSACGGESSSKSTAAADGKIGDQLNMFSWGEYDDPQVLKTFTKEIGPRLQVDSFGSNEEMIAKLVAANGTSGYDIVVPTGTFIPQMADNGLLEELDHSLLKNMGNLQDEFVDQQWDPGNRYSVCKTWGTTGFVYDNTKIKRELTSWADFLDAAGKEAAGQVSVLDDPKEVLGIAMFAEGIDVNTTDEAELDRVEQMILDRLAPHVKVFDSYPGSGAMTEGSSALLQVWNGDARRGILESKDRDRWTWVLPSEGANLWMDNWAIATGAQNVDEAYAFIDYVLRPEVSLLELAYNGYHTGVDNIEALANDEDLERLDMVFLSEEELGRLVVMELNEAQQRIVDTFGKLKAKAGA